MAQLVVLLIYKPEVRGFDFRWCHCVFTDIILPAALYDPWVESNSNRNECQEYFLGGKGGRCVRLTALSPSCADCHEIWEPQPPGTLRAGTGIGLPF